jgi:anti-anti-sigma factor
MLPRTRHAGAAGQILVLELPEKLVDETIDLVQEAVRDGLPRADGAAVVLDASQVALINSLGITCLLQIQDRCRSQQASMAIAALPQPIRTLLGQLRLDRRFDLRDTVDGAVLSLESGM